MDERETIEALRIIPKWKEKFLAISETKPLGGGWTPEFEDKAKYKDLPFWTKYNAWGLLFGVLFYFFKGMWKKGLLILGLTIVLSTIANATHNGGLLFVSYVMPSLIVIIHSNIDYYRKIVLGEDFWW